MKSLCVLYDSGCGLCVYCRKWVMRQTAYVPIEFVPQGSSEAARRYPELQTESPPQELIVIDDQGNVYRAEKAWLMILFALRRYRGLAIRLAKSQRIDMARRVYHWVSAHRYSISKRLWTRGEPDFYKQLDTLRDPPRCMVEENRVARFTQNKRDGNAYDDDVNLIDLCESDGSVNG